MVYISVPQLFVNYLSLSYMKPDINFTLPFYYHFKFYEKLAQQILRILFILDSAL
jgi:hypothetical protein